MTIDYEIYGNLTVVKFNLQYISWFLDVAKLQKIILSFEFCSTKFIICICTANTSVSSKPMDQD